MSSPSSRLKKVKRSPLPGTGRVPFRESLAAGPAEIRPPSDTGLLGSMAARLAQAESQLHEARQEGKEKEAKIRELEWRLSSLPHSLPPSDHQLQSRCEALQRQVQEMEEFLNDYGMIWVGSDRVKGHEEGVWVPNSSVPHKSFTVDFDLIVRNVESLNVLAGEGSTAVSSTPRGATLKSVEAVPLTLYANGLVLFRGPFRPFSDPHTQHCVQDLLDGYFPSELQHQFPSGVPFKLNDQRNVTFVPRVPGEVFPGSGERLGGVSGISTSELPGPRLSADQFLARLPASVVRRGRVVEIRSELSSALRGSPQPSSLTLLQTPALDHLRSRLASPSLTTLKVRSESGDCTFLLKMRAQDTIADVWSHLFSQAPPTALSSTGSSSDYHLVGGVTHQVYSDLSASLENCGLVPSATLYITKATTGLNSFLQ